jgi:O-antigen/teichoic acid export membrane protein
MSIGRQLIQNILTSWLGYGLRVIIGFAFVPFITATLGSERYGIWVIAFQVIGYFTLFDLGLERAVVKFVAHFAARKDFAGVSRIFSTAASIYILLGLTALAASWLFGAFAFGLFKGPLAVVQEGRGAFYLLGVLLALRLCFAPWISTVVGLQRADVINALDIGEELLRVALLVVALSLNASLTWLAAAVLGAGLVRLVGAALWIRIKLPEVAWKRSSVDYSARRDLFQYAGISFAITLAWLIVFGTDMVLLGWMASSAAAGLYGPAANLMLYLRNAVNAAGTPLAPAVANLDSRHLTGAVHDTYLKGIRYASFASVFLSAGVILFADPFVRLWLRPEFGETAGIMVILAVGSAAFIPQIIGNAVLFGLEKHRYLLAALGCEATLKLVLSLVLIGPYGAEGMAAATSISQVAASLTVYPYVMSRVIGISIPRLLMTQLRAGLPAALAAVPTALFLMRLMPADNWSSLATDIAVVTVVTALIGIWHILETSDRQRILEVLTGRGRRRKSPS